MKIENIIKTYLKDNGKPEEEMVHLTVVIPESIRTAFKTKAVRNQRTIRSLILGWIKKYLEEGK